MSHLNSLADIRLEEIRAQTEADRLGFLSLDALRLGTVTDARYHAAVREPMLIPSLGPRLV